MHRSFPPRRPRSANYLSGADQAPARGRSQTETDLGSIVWSATVPSSAARVNYPSLTATFWMSLFFGPLGFMSADRAAQEAHARGLPTARYWICFVMAWVIGPVLMLAIYFGVPAIAERYDGGAGGQSCPYLYGSEAARLYC